ncbi:CAP domain-containing protein [Streptomyces sp. NPDC090021]|uniref:CAP domain-containing protein n=1 Tax=Streptomyces sp. NPDC090021 TaxID=3365919 RepID=UPI0038276CF3
MGGLALTAACVAGSDVLMPSSDSLRATAHVGSAPASPGFDSSSDITLPAPATPPSPRPTPLAPTAPPSAPARPAPSKVAPSPAPVLPKPPKPSKTAVKPTTKKPTPSKLPAPTPGKVLSAESADTRGAARTTPATAPGGQAEEVIRLTNVARAAAGCSALKPDASLTKAAQSHSDGMAASRTMSHTGADGSQPADRIAATGYRWSRTGENIATGQRDAASVIDAWMNSPGHRANILNCAFTEIGVGVSTTGGSWWTQSFATPA